ncbi:MAG: hypothetical protein KA152_03160 [Verrucomicrobiales bacterium]|nr:hypothetical protein [Verrucomicrobiales bacterium]HQW27613.1 hypothetical protein [Verrucomicrobiales bacterium]
MKKLIVVVNDLERSGKSALARTLSHHLKSRDIKHLLVTSNELDMTDSFPGEFWDLEEQFEVSQLIAAIDSHSAVILDVHSGGARNWGDFFEAEDLENLLAELDAEMTLVIPDTRSERCNEEICDLTEIFADQADYVIAHLPGEARNEVKWKGSLADKAIRYLGASTIEMPGISDDLRTALDNAGIDFAEALNNPAALPRFAEVQLSQWIERASSSLSGGNEYFIPDSVSTVALDY